MFNKVLSLLLVIGGIIANSVQIKRLAERFSNKSPQFQMIPDSRGFLIGEKSATTNNGLLAVLSPLSYTSKDRNNLTSGLCCSSVKIQLSVYRSDLAQQRLARNTTTRLNKAYGIHDTSTAKIELLRCLKEFNFNKWFGYLHSNTPTAC